MKNGSRGGQMNRDKNKIEEMKKKVQIHYNLKRPVTSEELTAELENLRRKKEKGSLDDFSERLAVALGII